MNFYSVPKENFEMEFQNHIKSNLSGDFDFIQPYVVASSEKLIDSLAEGMILGTTATCQGFYHPQGRFLFSNDNISILEELRKINYEGNTISNFEMESSAILGLSKYFGFEACSISLILANRVTNEFTDNAEEKMIELIKLCLDRIALT